MNQGCVVRWGDEARPLDLPCGVRLPKRGDRAAVDEETTLTEAPGFGVRGSLNLRATEVTKKRPEWLSKKSRDEVAKGAGGAIERMVI